MTRSFGVANGYEGFSRSTRSQEAIDSHEVPISLFTQERISFFLQSIEDDESFSKEDLSFLKKQSVLMFRFAAMKFGPTSWHHTSSYYNKTDHYDLYAIAEDLCENRDRIIEEFRIKKEQERATQAEKKALRLAVVTVQEWGGTKAHPRVIGEKTVAGVVEGDWIYFKEPHAKDGITKKYKISAGKTIDYSGFSSYRDLSRRWPHYRGSKPVFIALAKERKGIIA
jgi:hypothetical protein